MKVNATILDAGLRLYDRLERLATSELPTKKDLLLLSFISEILTNNCHYEILSTKQKTVLIESFNRIVRSNKNIPFFRIDHNLYKNLGGKQNITSFQPISASVDMVPITFEIEGENLTMTELITTPYNFKIEDENLVLYTTEEYDNKFEIIGSKIVFID